MKPDFQSKVIAELWRQSQAFVESKDAYVKLASFERRIADYMDTNELSVWERIEARKALLLINQAQMDLLAKECA